MTPTHAQGHTPAGLHITENSFSQFRFEFTIGNIDTVSTPDGILLKCSATNSHNHTAGSALLPTYNRIIILPEGASPEITIDQSDYTDFTLSNGLTSVPCRTTKDGTEIGGSVTESSLVSIKELGIMRGQRMALLSISPFTYDESQRKVSACMHLTVTIRFAGSNPVASENLWLRLQSNAMTNGTTLLPKHEAKDYPYAIDTIATVYKYAIVAPTRFASSLQPFISWKRQQGFIVCEYYIDNANREEIKNYLQELYNNATLLDPAPLYVLLVGTTNEIPTWPAQHRISGLQNHVTDLYYGEYSGDYLPDALVGRLPAADTAQLNVMLRKTLSYEQYQLPDSNYFNRSLLVAGKELRDPAPTVSNGQINYLKEHLIRHDPGHDTICFYNPESDTLGSLIAEEMRLGVGLVNYTAHCTAWGWQHPSLTSTQIDEMNTGGELFIAINNCCRANDISTNCFGIHLLSKQDGGAVAAIGATNETIWEEDYYWSVGCRDSLSQLPQYEPSALGAYDRLFHSHGETYKTQAHTVGQMLAAGNWAVTNSASPYDSFYWEIYCLLGDPSLMPYIGTPAPLHIVSDSIVAGDMTLTLHGTPYAHVAATQNDTLLGTVILDNTGHGIMTTTTPFTDTVTLTATAAFHIPLSRQTTAKQPATARLTITNYKLNDTQGHRVARPSMCDTTLLSITMRNVGGDTAQGYQLSLEPVADNLATIIPSRLDIPTLLPGRDTDIVVAFAILAGHTPPTLTLSTTIQTPDSIAESRMLQFDIVHPHVEASTMWLKFEDGTVSLLHPNRQYSLEVELVNNGRGVAKDVATTLEYSTEYGGLTSTETLYSGTLETGERKNLFFTIHTNDSIGVIPLALTISHRCDTISENYCYTPSTTHEGFESGAMTHLPWLSNEWTTDNSVSHSGIYSVRSGHIAARDSSNLQLSLIINRADSISFWVKTSCRTGVDRLVFLVDGINMSQWYGEKDWRRYSCLLTAGRHELWWFYTKSDSIHTGNDCVWIDDLQLPLAYYETDSIGYDNIVQTVSIKTAEPDIHRCHISPNPAHNSVCISMLPSKAQITIHDIYGRVVEKMFAETGGEIQYNTKRLRCGVYHVTIDCDGSREIHKLIISR